MYRDLLTQALGKGEEGRRSDDLLLADLVDSRARLHATGAAAPVAEALARELSYDGALIRLCVVPRRPRPRRRGSTAPGASGPVWSRSWLRGSGFLHRGRHVRSPDNPPEPGPPACSLFPSRGPRRPSVESAAVPGDDERMVEAGGHEVRISRPDKIYFPGLGATKLDLVSYYLEVGDTC